MGLERIIYTGEVAARLLGPGAVAIGQDTYRSDLTKTFIQFTLMHSFPKGNLNGMTFLPPLLAKAIPTANNQPLNLDHQLEGNPDKVYQGEDMIVGAMLKAYLASIGEVVLLPSNPIPVKIVGVLWNRSHLAQKIINSIGQNEKQYKTSFEVIRDVSEDGWVVKGDDGIWNYQSEIAVEMLESWQNEEYDNVLLAVGGDGSGNSTNFWGGAFTLSPADPDAEIDEVLTGCFDGGECAIAAHYDPVCAKVVPYKAFPKADENAAWSFSAKDFNALLGPEKNNWSRARPCFCWYDSEKPNLKGSYHLPVAKMVGGIIKTFWHGIRAAMGILLGARGGIKFTTDAAEKKGIYNRLKKYYKLFDKEVPEYGSYTDTQLVAMGFDMAEIGAYLGELEIANQEEDNIMPPTKIALGEAGFSLNVVGRQLTLTMGEETVKQPEDFYLSAYKMRDGDYALSASLTREIPDKNGFNQQIRLEYNPEGDTPSMDPVEEGAEKVKTQRMYETQIKALTETISTNTKAEEQVRAEFAEYISPADHKKAVDDAVKAALAEADKGNLFTEDQLKTKIDEAVQEALDKRDASESAAIVRGERLVAEGFNLTQDRKNHIATFAVSEEGDKSFEAWVTELKANNIAMIKALEKAGIDVDDNIKSALAHINSINDGGFGALVASRGHNNIPTFSPSMSTEGDGTAVGSTSRVMF